MAEIGKTGLVEFSGQIQEDFIKELRGREGYKKYNEMRLNSPIISALLFAYEMALRKVSWEFHAEDENDPRLELLEAARANMSTSWNDHITEALTMLPFGFSIFEIVYERVGSQVLWRKFAPRGQDTVYQWKFDDTGGLEGFVQMSAPTYKPTFIPISKLILYRTRVERGNPEGRSMLRGSWIPYYYAKHIGQIEAIGIERDLNGFPVIVLPEGADTADNSTSDYGKAREVVRNVRNDEQAGLTLPFGWDFKLVASSGTKNFDTDKVIRRYENRMLMSVLSQFLMLGSDGVGSLALSKDHTDLFNMSVNSISDIIAETFTKYAIPRLLKLNGYDSEGITLSHTLAGDVDVTMLADALQKIGGMVTWDAQDELWLRQVMGLPEKDIDQLTEAREMEDEKNQRIASSIASKTKSAPQEEIDDAEEETPEDEMSADYFSAPPSDKRKRTIFENSLLKKIAKSLKRQKSKVLASAKGMM